MHYRAILFLLTWVAPLVLMAAPVLRLTDQGKAQLPIILAADASDDVRHLATELAAWLERISGASFAIEEGDGSRGIVLGNVASFPAIAVPESLKAESGFHHLERYLLRSEPQRLLLIGATDKGVSHAAFHLLRELGCRWFFPGSTWEVIPEQATLAIAIDAVEGPALLGRRIWYGYGAFDRQQKRMPEEHAAWNRHNRMGASIQSYTGHAWQGIILRYKKTFEEHPEYLALVKDERRGDQLCVSNPGLRRLIVEHSLDFFRRQPDRDMVSLDPADGAGHCECEPCAALGTISDRVFGLANEAAKAVAAEFPGKMVGLLAYSLHSEPPAFKLEPNVYLELTRGFTRGRYTFDQLKDLWPQHARAMGYYDYYSVYLWDWDMPPGGRAANMAYIAESIRDYTTRNAWTLSCESGNNWGLHGRGYYLAAQLMWNPQADDQAILADFYDKAFGPAAAPMQRYYERLDPGTKPLLSEHLFAMALRDLEEASTLAANHPAVLARLTDLKQYMHFVSLRWDFNHSADKARKRELALAILTHVYRNRYTYMNHWEALRQHTTRHWAKEFEEPTWSFQEPTRPKAWEVDEPNSPELTAAQFAADLERFQPRPITERSFSANLVPAGLTGPGQPVELNHRYQHGVPYYVYSLDGEPIEFAFTPGTIAWYRDRPDATWQLLDAKGQKVAGDSCVLDGEPRELKVDVPAAGLYRLELAESGAGFRITIPAGRPAVVDVERARRYHHSGHMQRVWFYVPKGTEVLSYFIVNSSPHHLYGPDGARLEILNVSGDFVNYPVPEGMDGKAWSMSHLSFGQLWFFNVPTYLAASPHALMVPAELRDELR